MNVFNPSTRPPEADDATGLDLVSCDREPIQTPGAIQPHGLLLVVDPATGLVTAGAGDVEGRLAADWLQRPLAELLGGAAASALLAAAPGAPSSVERVQGAGGAFEGVGVVGDGALLVQLEPVEADLSAAASLTWLDAAGGGFERAADLKALCVHAAQAFRELTGFDRVMIYRFLDDDAGVVVAEDRDPELHAFLNHHFPASDIPRQARALYVRNRVRVIPDVDYAPAPIRPEGPAAAALDLSDIDLRSVSPIHVQYLKNMGVRASASVSIVKDGLLWGLVACHHGTPRTLSRSKRLTCRALAGGLARQVRAKEEAEDYRERLRLRSAEDAVVGSLQAQAALDALFSSHAEALRRMLGADGFVAVQGKALHGVGRLPDELDVREVAAWAARSAGAQALHTRELSRTFPPAAHYREFASGLLAVTVSLEEPVLLMWFRAEEREVLEWAGNPHKPVGAGAGGMLTPRASFEAWSEEVRGRARPWTPGEIEAAHRLTRALFEARQTRRIRDLVRELTATVADKENLLVQKDQLIREVNHRIQNSLQLVSAFLSLQARAANDAALSGHLAEAQRRLSAVALVHRRLYSDDNVETIDLGRYLEDLCGELRASMGPDWAEGLTLDLAPILIPADSAVNVGLILTELVINANKYAYAGAPGPLSIGLEQHRNRFRLIVADRGPGKTGDRQGFGTRMLNAMVERLGGVLEESDNRPGLRVIVTAPIAAAALPPAADFSPPRA